MASNFTYDKTKSGKNHIKHDLPGNEPYYIDLFKTVLNFTLTVFFTIKFTLCNQT